MNKRKKGGQGLVSWKLGCVHGSGKGEGIHTTHLQHLP